MECDIFKWILLGLELSDLRGHEKVGEVSAPMNFLQSTSFVFA